MRADELHLAAPPRRLLAVKAYGLGDAILIGSLIEHLMRRHPQMEVGVLVGKTTEEAMARPGIARIHHYMRGDFGVSEMLRELHRLRRCRYDIVLDFEQESLIDAAFAWATGIPIRVGFVPLTDNPRGFFLTHALRFRDTDSMWQSFVRLVRLVEPGLSELISALPLACPSEVKERIALWWHEHVPSRPAVAFHMGGNALQPFKRWPIARFVQLAKRIRMQYPTTTIVLTGQPSESSLVDEFVSHYDGQVANATNIGSVRATAALLSRCDLLVSNDTGPMHLGAAMGTPTVGLFGPTAPKHFAPVGIRAASAYATGVKCSPCISNYYEHRPIRCENIQTSRCLHDLTVDVVMGAIHQAHAVQAVRRSPSYE
jgi:ADP-heptose:LPS heptosyltransferase